MTIIKEIQRKINNGSPVRVVVFCSAGADRSPLIEQVFKKELELRGLDNVAVTSFGTSVNPAKHKSGASQRTIDFAKAEYPQIASHLRRSVADEDVKKEIADADLLVTVSQEHRRYLARHFDQYVPRKVMLAKTYTLRGLARGTQWTGIPAILASVEPNPAGSKPFDRTASYRKYGEIVSDAKRCIERLAGKPRNPQSVK